MRSRSLLLVILVLISSFALTIPVQAKDYTINYNGACVGGILYSSQLLDLNPSVPNGLRDKGRWVNTGVLEFSNTSHTATISGITGSGPYQVVFRTHNGDNYTYYISAPVTAINYTISYNGSTNAVLLSGGVDYPVTVNVNPENGTSYAYYYRNVDTGITNTGSSGITSASWSFNPTLKADIYSVYSVVTHTVGGNTCRSETNRLDISRNITLQVVGGESVCQSSGTFELEVIPFDPAYNYVWTLPSGATANGRVFLVDLGDPTNFGEYVVQAFSGATLVATSDPVSVGSYVIPVSLNPAGSVPLCEGSTAPLTGVATHPSGTALSYQWIRDGVLSAQGTNGGVVNVQRQVSVGGEYTFKVFESTNPLCYAISNTTIVNLGISASPMPVSGSSVCEGSPINNITLNNSQVGVTYHLMYDNGSGTKVSVEEWTSTADGQTHIFSSVLAVGSYTVEAESCSDPSGYVQMIGGPFVISDFPNKDLAVVRDGSGCEGDTHTITVVGAQAGVTYQLLNNGTPASLAVTATGANVVFSGLTASGNYTVRASRNSCSVILAQSVRIGVVPQSQTFSPNTACADIPFTLTLDNSEPGVQYTIYSPTNAVVSSLFSNAAGPLGFNINRGVGTYRIEAVNEDGCTREIGTFTLLNQPNTAYTISTNNNPACAGVDHVIRLSGSQAGFAYRLIMNGETTVNTVIGTGGPIVLGTTSVAGIYTVQVSNGGCDLPIPGNLRIVPLPDNIPVVASNYCEGDDVEIRLNTSQNGAIYRLFRNGVLYGSVESITGDGSAIIFSDKFPDGTYTVRASFAAGACERQMTGVVVVNELPNVGINASNYYCRDAGTITLGGTPQLGTTSWSVGGFTTSPAWFNATGSTATVNVPVLIDSQAGASDRVTVTFYYTFIDPVTGCEATASRDITFVDDQTDNLRVRYRLDPSDAWSLFTGTLLTCQAVNDIYLSSQFIDSGNSTLSGEFTTNARVGSITDNHDGTAVFHPDVAGNGLWTVTYTYRDPDSGCDASVSYNIQVGVSLSLEGVHAQYCESNNTDQAWYGLPEGGTLAIMKGGVHVATSKPSATSPYMFNPQALGPGEYEVIYSYTSGTGTGNECENEIRQTVTVRNELDPLFDTVDGRRVYCITNGPVTLLPAAGAGSNYSGPGVGASVFRPDLAGVGTHRITRTVSDGFCTETYYIDVDVVEPDVAILLPKFEFCHNETDLFPVEAGDFHVSGSVYSRDKADKSVQYTFSTNAVNALFRIIGGVRDYRSSFTVQDGDSPIYFDPTRVPAIGGSDLTINIYLQYNSPVDEGGCQVNSVLPVKVNSVQDVNFGAVDPLVFCQNSDPVILEGRFSSGAVTGSGWFTADFPLDNEVDGPGTDNNGRALFDPSLVTPTSAYQITYHYTNPNGCVSTRTKSFEILPAPIKQRVTPVDPNDGLYCQGSTGVVIGLEGSQAGVRYYLQKDGVDVDPAVQFIDGALPGNIARTFPNPVTTPGVYTVRAEMIGIGSGCDAIMDGSVIVAEKVVTGVLESISHEGCAGSNDGKVSFSAYGGLAPYVYILQQGGTTITNSASGTFEGLPAGTYTVRIEDAAGCDWTSSPFEIKAGYSISVDTDDVIDVVCFGENTGSFTVLATGLPSGNYEFQLSGSSDWLSNGTGRYVFENLPAGTYQVTVRDAANISCAAVTPQVVINQPASAVTFADVTITNIDCSVGPDGAISVRAAGGNAAGGFNYVLYREVTPGFWVNIAASSGTVAAGTSQVFNNLYAGNYRIVASDIQGCSFSGEYTVEGPTSLPVINLSGDEIVHVSQPGYSDGAIEIAITGGSEPYSIVWERIDGFGGAVSGTLTGGLYRQEGLEAGYYRVTVTDANGCTDVLEAQVLDNAYAVFELQYTTVNPGPCFGSANGRVNLRAVGGIAPYQSLTLTNGLGQVLTPASSGNSFANFGNLPAGTYIATVTDSRGVTISENVTLNQPDELVISYSIADALCFGDAGNLEFGVEGGTPFSAGTPYYTYQVLRNGVILASGQIEVGQTIEAATDFSAAQQIRAGEYSLWIQDAVGCVKSVTFTIAQPEHLAIVTEEVQHIHCYGAAEGFISVSVTGRPGGTSYSFQWQSYDAITSTWVDIPGNAATQNSLTAGVYRVRAIEVGSVCESGYSAPITIVQPAAALDVTAEAFHIKSCYGDNSGKVRLSVLGGTAPYTIEYGSELVSWDGLSYYELTGLTAGNYDFVITDANGCSEVVQAVVEEPSAFSATVTASGIDCDTPSSAWIDLSVDGGVDINGATSGGFAYRVQLINKYNNQLYHNQLYIDPAAGVIQLTDLPAGNYTLRVRDANSTSPELCEYNFDISLHNVAINAHIQNPICGGIDNGSISIDVVGGSGNFAYIWTSGGTTLAETGPVLTNLAPGTYQVEVEDLDNGCTITKSFTLSYTTTLSINVDSKDVTCHGGNDGRAEVFVSGGTAPYFYLWEHESSSGIWSPVANTQVLSGRSAGTYRVRVTDSNNCQIYSPDVVIGEPADYSVASITYDHQTVSCHGGANGSFTVVMDRAGIFEYSIDGVNWQPSATFVNLAPGTYRISVRDMERLAPYCAKYEVVTATVFDTTPVEVDLISQTDINCFGGNTGVLTINASGGTGPYTYQWYQRTTTANVPLAGHTNAIATALVAGTYFVEVRDANGCTKLSDDFTLVQPASAVSIAVVNTQNASAPGAADGSITISIDGGSPGYTITWYEGNTAGVGPVIGSGLTLSGLTGGEYTVLVTDNAGCTSDMTITISEPGTALSLHADIANAGPCFGATNGAIELEANGGTAPYTFTLIRNPGAEISAANISGNYAQYEGLGAGFYTARVSDANGVVVELTDLEVSQPEMLEIFFSDVTDVSCYGEGDGMLRFSVKGGTPFAGGLYSYVLSRSGAGDVTGAGNVAVEINDLNPDSYILRTYDANGCMAEFAFTIEEPSDIAIDGEIQDVSCFGANDGSIALNVSGGTSGAYSYEWQVFDNSISDWVTITGAGGSIIQNLEAGRYKVIVTDLGSACQKTSEFMVGEPSELIVSFSTGDVLTCRGDNSGSIELRVEGGTGPYVVNYGTGLVSGFGPVFTLNSLAADTYSIIVSDSKGCQKTVSATIDEPAEALSVSEPIVSISCVAGVESFSVGFEINGGVAMDNGSGPEYLYNIEVINLLTSGRRYKTVGTAVQPVTVNLDDLNLPAGLYRLIVTDLNAVPSAACAAVETTFGYSHLSVTYSIADESCPGAYNGIIDLTVSGGSGDYSYSWLKNGLPISETTQDLSGLEAGIYTVTITDNGEPGRCLFTQSFTVDQAKQLLVEGSVRNVSCFDGNDGAIRIHGVANATLPLTFYWNGSSVPGSNELTGLSAGSYSVEVVDGDGCAVQAVFMVTQPSAPLKAELSATLDCATDTRTITVVASGGTGPYTYQWMGPGAYTRVGDGATITGITGGGVWQVEVTDVRGCKVVETIEIYGKISLSAYLSHISCNGGDAGNIILNIEGGSGSYQYSWTKDGVPVAATTKDISNLEAGTYQVVVTDELQSCGGGIPYIVTSGELVIYQPEPFVIEGNVTHNECFGSKEGRINLHTVAGGTAPYEYVWSTGNGSGLVQGAKNQSGLGAGTYYIRVIDSKGCSSDPVEFVVNQLDELSFDLVVSDTDCDNENSIQILNPVGGSGAYSFFWDGPGVDAGTDFRKENLPGGTYTITMVDMGTTARCYITKTVSLTQPLSVTNNVQPETCMGMANGTITLDVKGGQAPYSFSWDAAPGVSVNSRNQAALGAGTYRVVVTDNRGCTFEQIITVPLLYSLELQAAIDHAECFGDSNGAIYLSVLNGSGSYTYHWTKGGFNATTKDITNVEAGTYRVTVSDNVLGCTITGEYTVDEPSDPIAVSIDDIVHNDCFGDRSGAISVTVTGGTAPYTFHWGGPGILANPSTEDQTGLRGGEYYLTVVDARGCELSNYGPITVLEPNEPVSIELLNVTPVTANGLSNGAITIQVSGGSGNYTSITWVHDGTFDMSGFSGLTYASGLPGGTYTITAIDDKGCSAQLKVVVFEPGYPFEVDIEKQASGPCKGAGNGTIWVQLRGGVQPYKIVELSGGSGVLQSVTGQSTVVFEALAAGDYTVTAEDNFGNVITRNVTINEHASALNLVTSVTTQVECREASTGAITARVTGGIPNSAGEYRLILSGGPAGTSRDVVVNAGFDFVFDNLPAGTYSLRVIDDSNPLRVAYTESDLQAMFGDDNFSVGDDCSVLVSGLIVHQPEATVTLSVVSGMEELCEGEAPHLQVSVSGWNFADGNLLITLSNGESFTLNSATQELILTILPVDEVTNYSIVSVATDPMCIRGVGVGVATVTTYKRPAASISGQHSICEGESAALRIDLTGAAPWTISYSDGVNSYWVNNISASPYYLDVSPSVSTNYSLVSVSDSRCTGSVSGSASVTIPITSVVSIVNPGARNLCQGQSSVVEISFAPDDNGPWQLYYSEQPLVTGVPSGSPVTRNVTVTDAMFNASGNYEIHVTPDQSVRVKIENVISGGCEGKVSGMPVDLIVSYLPPQPGVIEGPGVVCQGGTATYSIPAISGVSHYVWTLPDGSVVTGGRQLTVSYGVDAQSGRLSVFAVNSCGDGPVQYLDITVEPLPDANAGIIIGPEDICQGSKGVVFTVSGNRYADSYIWEVPATWLVTGQGTDRITVDLPDDLEYFNGYIKVIARNNCGDAVVVPEKAVYVRPLPVADAGPDQPGLCSDVVTLGATPLTTAQVAAGYSARWMSLPVSGSADEITDIGNPNVTVTGLTKGDVTFRWIVTSPFGCESYDDVTVRNNTLNVSAYSASGTVCEGVVMLHGTPTSTGITGQWTAVYPAGSTAQFDNASLATVLVTNMPVGENRFRWSLTQNGCTSYAEVTVINSQPADAEISGPQVISNCGEDIEVRAVEPLPGWGLGRWSVVSGYAEIDSPTSAVTMVRNISMGEVVLEWRVNNGLCSDAAYLTIRNNKLVVDAGSDQEICSPSTVLDASELPSIPGVTGSWSFVTGSGGFVNAGNPKTTVNNLSRGEIVLRWTVNNNGCLSFDDVRIVNNTATTAVVGSQQSICGDTYALTGNDPAAGEVGTWTVVKGSGIFDNLNDPGTTVRGLDSGENIFRWTINNNNKCSSFADLRIINLKVPVDAGKDTVVCDNIVTLRGSLVPAGASGIWRIVGGAGGAVITIEDPSRPHIAKIGLGEGSNTIIWEINYAGCYSRDTVVVVNSRPYPVNGGDPIRYVTLADIYMNATPVGPGMTGEWVLISGNGNIENPYDPNTRVTNLARGENLFRWIVTNGNCSDYAEVLIVNGDVVDADAGRPQTVCVNYAQLEANDPQGAIGTWTVIQGSAIFDNPSNPRTRVTNLSPGENILRWTIRYGSSEYSSSSYDDVIITNNQPDEAFAGNDIALCADQYQLRGNAPRTTPHFMGSPKWTIISGGGDLDDETDPTTYVRNLAKGQTTLVYSITKGACVRTDTLVITNGLPSEPYAGEDDTSCDDFYLLNPSTPVYGTAAWRPGSTGGAQFDGNMVRNLAQGPNELIYEISTEWCTMRDTIIITNNKPSQSFAGHNREVCSPTYTLAATAPQYGVGSWTLVAGAGTIDPADVNNPDAVVTGLGMGSNRFKWTVNNNGCISTSEVEIRNNFIEANAGEDNVVCSDQTQLRGSNPSGGVGTWGIKGGSGSAHFANPNDPLTKVTNLDRGDNVLTWTITNGNCSHTDEVVITNNMPTIANAGEDQMLCDPETVLQGNLDVVGQGRWTIRSGSATLHSDTYADPYEDPSARVTGLSFGDNILRWTIVNNGCESYDDVVLQYNRIDADAGSDKSVCDDEVVLNAKNPTPGTGTWSIPGGQGSANFESPTSPTTRVRNLGRGANTLRWTVRYNGCVTYDDVVVNNNLPSIPYAGNDQVICSDTYIMDATPPSLGSSGRWTVITGSAVFEDETLHNTRVTGLANGDNIFVWTTERVDGCTLQDEVVIRNSSVSEPYAGTSYEELCSSTFNLKAAIPDYGTGSWSFVLGGGNISDPYDPRATVTTLAQGTNILRWTISQDHCSKYAEVTLVNNEPTRANAGPDIEDCKDYQTLDANVPLYYDEAYWERISGYGDLDNVNDPKTTVRNLGFGPNEFMWTIRKGSCITTDRVVIFNKIPDKAFAGSDQEICENYTVLNANDPLTGSGKWSVIKGSGTFDDPNQYNTIVRSVGFGENIYRWEVTYGECGTFDEVIVVSNRIEAYAGEDQVVYSPEAVLNANNAGDLDAKWIVVGTSTAVLEDPLFFNTRVNNLNEGINTFRWEISVNGCVSYDQVSVDYRPVPDAAFITDVNSGCYPLRVQFTNYSVGGSVYHWDFGDGNSSGDRNPVHVFEEPGAYQVVLTSPGPDGNDGLFTKTIVVYDHPVAYFTVNPQVVYIPGDKARFYDLSTDAVSWMWDFGDGGISSERNPSYEYQEEGVFDVTLTVTSLQGCTDTFTMEDAITAELQGFVVFPNAFKPRPGGSSGAVDPSAEYVVVFKPAYSDVAEFKLEIFNRWGQRIFVTDDINNGWDGMYEGQLAPQGVYVYLATGKYVNGREFRKTGNVLLVR
jgi:PKD repeat protein